VFCEDNAPDWLVADSNALDRRRRTSCYLHGQVRKGGFTRIVTITVRAAGRSRIQFLESGHAKAFFLEISQNSLSIVHRSSFTFAGQIDEHSKVGYKAPGQKRVLYRRADRRNNPFVILRKH
jgi:hypothetical protein